MSMKEGIEMMRFKFREVLSRERLVYGNIIMLHWNISPTGSEESRGRRFGYAIYLPLFNSCHKFAGIRTVR